MGRLRVTIEMPGDIVEHVMQVGVEMSRESGLTYMVEETTAVLVVCGIRTVTTEIEFNKQEVVA